MLKTIFNCKTSASAILATLLIFLSRPTLAAELPTRPATPVTATGERSVQRLAQMVDYVAADYSGAVRDGQVIDAGEYGEQRELIGEADKLVPELPGSDDQRAGLAAQLAAVVQAVDAKAAATEVQRRCRVVRQTLKDTFNLRLVPAAAIDPQRGATLFGQHCATCHGQSGHADTTLATTLKPPPVSFHDAARMLKVAPALAYHTLTFGVPGTAMVAFDQLSQQDRWNLAFYVVGLRHGPPGQQLAAPPQLPPAARQKLSSLALLAELSDEELRSEIDQTAGGAPGSEQTLAYLRTTAPFAEPPAGGRFDRARQLVGESVAAVRSGDAAAAHRLAIAAYLDGVEPHEAALRIEHPELLRHIETAFATLRQATDPGHSASVDTITHQAQAIAALLSDADSRRTPGRDGLAAKAFLASLTIALREGLEVALLIAALLAFLRKSGQSDLARSVHIGWLLSVPAGLLTFAVVGKLIDGARRELAEGILTLVAAAILLSVTHWVIGAKEARHWLGFLRRRIEAAGGGERRGQALWLAAIAFFAAYREALETSLFYRALLLDVGPQGFRQVLLGIAVGIAALAVLVVVVGRIGRKLNPRPVMLASSALLALLALALTGHGVHSLQEGGYLGMLLVTSGGEVWAGLPAVGIYPTWQGLGAQLTVLLLLLLPSLYEQLRRGRAARATAVAPVAGQPSGA